jgi:polygalacturonase
MFNQFQLIWAGFRADFFKRNWVENIGFKGHNFKSDTFNVTKYGAKNDCILKSTKGLQKAVDVCAKAGDGVVLIPAGRYLTGSIFMKIGVRLILDDSATLLGSMDLNDYVQQKTSG